MQRYDKLEVKLKDGQTIHWSADRWDDYDLDERAFTFTVIKSRAPVCVYDLSQVDRVSLEDTRTGCSWKISVGRDGLWSTATGPRVRHADSERGTMGVGQASIGIGPVSMHIGQASIAASPGWAHAGDELRHAEGGSLDERSPHLEGTPLDPERFHGHAVGWAPDWHYQHMEGTSVDSKSCHGHAEGGAPTDRIL